MLKQPQSIREILLPVEYVQNPTQSMILIIDKKTKEYSNSIENMEVQLDYSR